MKYVKRALIIIVCIAVNFLCMKLSGKLYLPLFFNAVGTCFACYFAGLAGGLISGCVSGLFFAPFSMTSVFYCIAGLITGAVVYFVFKKELLYRFITTLVSGYWIGILCAALSAVINNKYNNGYTLNKWGDALFDMLRHYNWSKPFASLVSAMFIEVIDKQLTFLIFFFIIQLISNHKNKEVKASVSDTIKKTVSVLILICVLVQALCVSAVSAFDSKGMYSDNTGFASRIYDKRDGLLSNAANCVCQTDDGYMWIGSNDGLLKYDGSSFEHVFPDSIPNVSALFCDSKGRLWIGTVDSGLAMYDGGPLTFFTTDNGMPGNNIRCIIEKGGYVYVSTSDRICKVDIKNNITIIDEDITYAYKMTANGDYIVGCDLNGTLFALDDDDRKIDVSPNIKDVFFTCVKNTSKGVLAGTNGYDIYTLNISDDRISIWSKNTSELENIHDICEDHEGRIWLCSENALGYYDIMQKYRRRHFNDAAFTYESLFVDYQNNAWITSSKYGLMKLSESNFLYLSERAGIPSRPVNAVIKYDGKYYYGMEDGLKIHDRSNNFQITNALTDALNNVSVRSMLVDKKNRLWVCTYNAKGLYIYDGNTVKTISRSSGLTSDNCRNIAELSDGTVAVGTADGLNIIKNDEVYKTITKADGLNVSQILCLCAGDDGFLYAGTDGGGMVVIDDGEITKQFTAKTGLPSDVVLSMASYNGGMLISTSSHMCYVKGDTVKVLGSYPYDNCYDIVKHGEDSAYILGEAGVCDVGLSKLTTGDNPDMYVYDDGHGLNANITSYSHNFIDDDGSLVFCTNMGALVFGQIDKYSDYDYKFGITSIMCDGKEIYENEGVFEIPKDTKYISIAASVRNFTLEDLRVKFYIDEQSGAYSSEITQAVGYRKIPPISIYDPEPGDHTVHIKLYDNDGNLVDEKSYTLLREMRMWEYLWFKIYAIIVFIETVMMFTASIIFFYIYTKRNDELETIRTDLEKTIEENTKDLMDQQMKTVIALSDAIDAKDRYTSGHSARVAFYSRQIAARLGKTEDEQNTIYRAGLLHDIGKIRVPGSIISKPGRLTEDEYTLMKLHPVTGFHILKSIGGDPMFAQGAHYHHERYDGKGYPNGLSGDNIPEIARIIGVADAYDAMSSRRSYHDTFSQEYIRTEIKKGSGTQFDPVIADIMLKMMEEDNLYSMKERDEKRVILVIDDKQKRIDEIREIMKDESKYNILGALSGEIGLSIMDATNVDLVLLDVNMPGMDGKETLKAIREHHSVPVIFMVEVEKLYTMQFGAEIGADDLLTKPYVPIVLKEIVHNYTKTFEQGV